MVAGISLEDLPGTTLKEIDLAWRAKELELFLWTRTEVELRMNEVSVRSLGASKREEAERYAKDPKLQEQDEADERVGLEDKAKMHERWLYSVMPEHMRAMHDALYGQPGKPTDVKPLEGVSRRTAKVIVDLLTAKTFTHGPWAKNHFRLQLLEGDARARLEATAEPRKKPSAP